MILEMAETLLDLTKKSLLAVIFFELKTKLIELSADPLQADAHDVDEAMIPGRAIRTPGATSNELKAMKEKKKNLLKMMILWMVKCQVLQNPWMNYLLKTQNFLEKNKQMVVLR